MPFLNSPPNFLNSSNVKLLFFPFFEFIIAPATKPMPIAPTTAAFMIVSFLFF